MQFLGVPPGAAVAVFAQVFDHEPDVFKMADAGLGMPKPKALRVALHQGSRPRHQFRRGRCWRRELPQFFGFCGRGGHEQMIQGLRRLFKSGG